MNYIVVASLVLALAAAIQGDIDRTDIDKFLATVQTYGIECADDIKPGDAEMERLLSKQLPQTHEGKCVIACIYKRLKCINENGKLEYDNGLAIIEPVKKISMDIYGKMKTIMDTCKSKVADDPDVCEFAYNHLVCARATAKEVGLDDSMYA